MKTIARLMPLRFYEFIACRVALLILSASSPWLKDTTSNGDRRLGKATEGLEVAWTGADATCPEGVKMSNPTHRSYFPFGFGLVPTAEFYPEDTTKSVITDLFHDFC